MGWLREEEIDYTIGDGHLKDDCHLETRRTLMSEIKYEILKTIGVLSTSASGWSKELNLISWNDREPKYDLRDWSADHEKMGKGVTLSREELLALRELLSTMEL
jgi:hypothetical protein